MLRTEMLTITAADTAAAAEVVQLATDYLVDMATARAERGDHTLRTALKNGELIRSTFCMEASDAVTRAALNLGIMATREVHDDHHLTSFAEPTSVPDEHDLVLDMTWGQYRKWQRGSTYFGNRAGLSSLIPTAHALQVVAAGIVERQTVYTPPQNDAAYATWLRRMPLLPSGNPVLGAVDRADYPDAAWTTPYPTQPSIW